MKRKLLRRRILGTYDTMADFCRDLNMGQVNLSRIVSGEGDPTCKVVRRMCELLDVRQGEIGEVFFPDVKE